MEKKTSNDTKVSRELLKFAIPTICSLLVLELYNMVDTIFVGRYVGAYAIGGLTIAFPIQKLMISTGLLISVGSSTYVARYYGEKNIQKLKSIIVNSLLLTILLLLPISLLTLIFKKQIINALGASVNTFPFADNYISIILIGGVFQSLSTAACYIMKALGNTRITLYSNSLGAVCNVIFNYILVVIFKLGVTGAGAATVISEIAAFAFAMYEFKKVKKSLDIHFTIKYIDKIYIKNIIAVGLSTFIVEISDAVVSALLNDLLISKGGDSAIIIVGIITKISMFMFIPIIGISLSMQPIVSYNLGLGSREKIKKALKLSIAAVTVTSFVLWIVLMTFSSQVIGLFVKDAEILKNAEFAFRMCISLIPLTGIYYVCIYYYQAIGRAKLSFFLSIYRQLVVFIPVAIMFVEMFGTVGAWIAYPVSDFISFATSVCLIRKAAKVKAEKEEHERIKNRLYVPNEKYGLCFETVQKFLFESEISGNIELRHITDFEERIKQELSVFKKSINKLEKTNCTEDTHLYYMLMSMLRVKIYEAYMEWCEETKNILMKKNWNVRGIKECCDNGT